MDQQLYETTLQAVEDLKQVRLEQVQVERDLAEAEYAMTVAQGRVERSLIAKAGGDEKRLGLTSETRSKTYAVALDGDEAYKEKRTAYMQKKMRSEEVKVEVMAKHSRLQVMLAAMRAQEIRIEVPQENGVNTSQIARAAT